MEDGWYPDPYGIHEERLFAHGEPTSVVRNDGIGSLDAPPVTGAGPAEPGSAGLDATPSNPVRPGAATGDGRLEKNRQIRHPTKPMLALAALLIAGGVVVGYLGLGGSGSGSTTTTTENPIVRVLPELPRATTPLIPPQQSTTPVSPTTAALTPLEQALAALPKSTTPPATATATAKSGSGPVVTSAAVRVTQPPKRAAPTPTSSVVPATTLPLTTMTTSVSQADRAWVLAYGSVFNTLQSDVEQLDRALQSTSPDLYPDVHPYWQDLFVDANYAASLPPIPDSATQSEWSTALSDLNQGAAACILGTAAAPGTVGFIPATFDKGSSLVTTGTTQLDSTISSIESLAAATSVPSRSQVRAWDQAHGPIFATLQTDISKVDAAFPANEQSDYSAVDPFWQQLLSDAQSAMQLPPIPDALIQSYWSTALSDLIQGSSDCLGSSEALPPNLFDQGVASRNTGATYLGTSVTEVQALIG
jgi:hypothetical protein